MAERICPQCGYEGRGKKLLRGSKTMEIVIWTTLVLPGPLYSIWRRSGVRELCPNCERGHMVSIASDAGYVIKKRLELELGPLKTAEQDSSSPTPRSSSSNAGGVSLTDNTPRTESHTPVDPDAW